VTHSEARAQFPVLERLAHLNAGSFGPLPRVAADAMAAQAKRDVHEGRGGHSYLDAMFELRDRLRSEVAALLGAQSEQISVTSSTTDGCNIVLAGLRLTAEDEVVTTDAEHFGLAGPVFASRARVRVARVEDRPAGDAVEAVLAKVTQHTRLIAVSHVFWTTGHVLDVHALKAQAGVPVLVDGAQSLGAIPVNAGALDFYTVSGQKWLCGPESTGALYVRDPEALSIARPGSFAQESFVPGGEFVPRAGAQRFDPGWVSVAALLGLEQSLQIAPDWRFDRIAELAAHCREALLASGLDVVTEPGHAGLVAFVPREDSRHAAQRAFEQDVVIRDLPGTGWLRASCGWWNDEDDVGRLVDSLRVR
jgi:L-cysteine/cystine lyase